MDRHELVRNAVGFLSDPSVDFCSYYIVLTVANISFPVSGLVSRTEGSVPRGKRSDVRRDRGCAPASIFQQYSPGQCLALAGNLRPNALSIRPTTSGTVGLARLLRTAIPYLCPEFPWLKPLRQITAVVSGAITYGAVSLFRVSDMLQFFLVLLTWHRNSFHHTFNLPV
jgi:hypothetical protein